VTALKPPPGFTGRFFTDLAVRSAYSEGAGPFRIVPAAVAMPADRSDVARLARWAADTATPLTPRGAGTGIPGNNVGAGVVADLSFFERPLRVSLQQTANAGAAVTCAMLNQVGAHFGFRLGPDPSSAAYCTVGGMVATNAAGARSLRTGSIRAWVRGIELVTVDGEAGWLARHRAERVHRHSTPAARRQLVEHLLVEDRINAVLPRLEAARPHITARFPGVRKNSAGYALDAYLASGELLDLVIGSEGTLGIVTRAELQLERVPGATGTLLVALADLESLGDVVATLLPYGPVAVELLDRSFLDLAPLAAAAAVPLEGARAVLLVDFDGSSEAEARAALDAAERAVAPAALRTRSGVSRIEREALWRVRHGASAALATLPSERRSLQVIEDGCVPVGALGRYLAGVHAAATEADVPIVAFGHAGDGHLHVNALVDVTVPGFEHRLERLLDAVTTLVVDLGGTTSGEHGDGRLRATALGRLYGPEVVGLFAAVKQAFDPAGVLNPGVIVPDGAPPLAGLKVGPAAAVIPDDIADRLRHRERTGEWALPPLTFLDPDQ
jgi:FAD/FMN-containing dehydrogenase